MKYVVSGYIGFDNFGDEAIARVLAQRLKDEGAEKITMISANPNNTKMLHDVDACSRFNFIKSIDESDILIFGGGSVLQDVTSLRSLIYYLCVICTALFFGKKVQLLAQGIGPIKSRIGKFLTKKVLRNVEKISVRDFQSQMLLKSWGIDAELVNDPVFGMNITPKHQTGTVGIQIRECPQIYENKDFLENLAKELSQKFKEKNFEIISLQDSYDSDICWKFGTMLKQNGADNVMVCESLTLDDVIDRISGLEYLVAMRFHANVVGIKSEVKTIAIDYDPKVRKIAEEYQLPLIKLDGTNLKEVFEAIEIVSESPETPSESSENQPNQNQA